MHLVKEGKLTIAEAEEKLSKSALLSKKPSKSHVHVRVLRGVTYDERFCLLFFFFFLEGNVISGG